jgi:hypothetical protein
MKQEDLNLLRIQRSIELARKHSQDFGLNITKDKGDVLTLALMFLLAELTP